jgi:hypothetical protein
MIDLRENEKGLYDFLLKNPSRWVSKEEILTETKLFNRSYGKHDICSNINNTRIRLNQAVFEGKLEHLVLLDDNKLKIAETEEEAINYLKRDFVNAIKLLKRYYNNVAVIKRNGQGKLLDSENIPINESLEKRIYEAFEFEPKD